MFGARTRVGGPNEAAEIPFAPSAAIPASTVQEAIEYVMLNAPGGGPVLGSAPDDAEYLTSSSDSTLTNERVVQDSATIKWNFSTPSQASASWEFLGLEALTDPGADRGLFWDESEGAFKYFEPGLGLSFGGTGGNKLFVSDVNLGAIADLTGTFAQGDILYHDGTHLTRLPRGVDGQFLRTRGASNLAPDWQNVPGGGDMLRANNLSDLDDFPTARSNLGVGVEDSPEFTDLTLTGTLEVDGLATLRGGINLDGGERIYQPDNEDLALFGMDNGSGSPTGAYFQVFGNNYTESTQRGGAEFVFDNRNSGTGGFTIFETDGSSWTPRLKVDVGGDVTLSADLEVAGYGAFLGGSMPTQFADPGVYMGIESNGNANFNIVSTGTYGYFDIGGINEDYRFRFLTAIANGNTELQTAGTLTLTTGAVTSASDISVPDEAYDASSWNGSLEVPTKNALRDYLEALTGTTLPGTYQPLDADLTSLAGQSGTGMAARTASNTWTTRTITGTANEIALADGNGVSGNPTISLPSSLTFTGKTVTGGTFASPTAITGLPDPTNDQDAATKAYVDSVAQGLDSKPSVKAATTANITLSGNQTIDGVSITAGMRVLVKNQNTPAENGIYVSSASAWSRALDFDNWAEVPGAFVFVEEGTTLGNSGWTCTSDVGGTIGSTSVTFTQFSGAGTYTAGTGLSLTGTQFAISDAELLALAGLTSAADTLPYFTGSGTASTTSLPSYGRTLIANASAADARTDLGLVIGTDVQGYDALLASIAGLTFGADNFIYGTGSDTAAVGTITSVGRTLVSQSTQALMRTTGLGFSANGSSLVSAADYAAMRSLLDLEAGTDFYSITAANAAFAAIGRTLTAGAGLTGGGTLSADRTFDVGAGTGMVVNADDVAVDKASNANVRAAASNKVLTSDLLEGAAAGVALSSSSNATAVDWDAGINFTLTTSENTTISNPTNGQPGTWRTILVQGNDATDRTITFGNQFLGETPAVADCDNDRWYLLMIYCVSSTHFVVSAKKARGT